MGTNKSRLERKPSPESNQRQDMLSGGLLVQIGRVFMGAPYQAGLLEGKGRERLVVGLDAFDCTTFVETVLALAMHVTSGCPDRSGFVKHLKKIRYRGGKIAGYASRLHYFSDWIADNEKKKILKDVSRFLGGRPCRRKINFMSTHPDLYPALKNKTVRERIRQTELRLSRKTHYVIDKDNFDAVMHKIENGDIIAFASGQEGLDVAHAGFAVRRGASLRLLHASGKEGVVVVSRNTFQSYLKSATKFTGIHVARVFRSRADY
ncbi:MAG: DUF1460 domain-containing protein [Smithella sp.]|nr:DUF1460 domain-containing protein [Smithella sp.]